jgi:hypothetical protein
MSSPESYPFGSSHGRHRIGTDFPVAMHMRCVALTTLVGFVTAASGCASHQPMPHPLTPAAVAQVKDALESRGAWVEYDWPGQPPIVGAVQRGNFQSVGSVQPSLVVLIDEPKHAVPLENVRSIQINNHWRGAAEGLGVGLLSGALLGALLASGGESHCSPGDDHCIGMDFSAEILASSILLGSAIGIVVGASVGQRIVYTF